jgi:hypothetical protein
MMMADKDSFAYSLSEHLPSTWRWRVYDLEGGIAGMGEASTRADAESAINRVYGALLSGGEDPHAA